MKYLAGSSILSYMESAVTTAAKCMEVYCRQYYQNTFSWANTNFNGQKPHVFVLSTFSLSKDIMLWQTYFHGQSATFSWAKYNIFMGKAQSFHGQTELRVITRLVGVVHVVLSCSLRRKWVGREKGLAQYTSIVYGH